MWQIYLKLRPLRKCQHNHELRPSELLLATQELRHVWEPVYSAVYSVFSSCFLLSWGEKGLVELDSNRIWVNIFRCAPVYEQASFVDREREFEEIVSFISPICSKIEMKWWTCLRERGILTSNRNRFLGNTGNRPKGAKVCVGLSRRVDLFSLSFSCKSCTSFEWGVGSNQEAQHWGIKSCLNRFSLTAWVHILTLSPAFPKDCLSHALSASLV